MPKVKKARGRYKLYVWDPCIPIPKTTTHRNKKLESNMASNTNVATSFIATTTTDIRQPFDQPMCAHRSTTSDNTIDEVTTKQATTHLRDNNNNNNAAKINQGPSEKEAQKTTEKLLEENKIHQLKEEYVKHLEAKLKEREATIAEQIAVIHDLNQSLVECKAIQSSNVRVFDEFPKEKLIQLANSIYSAVGASSDQVTVHNSADSSKMVHLSERFPDIKMPFHLKLTLDAMKANEKHSTTKIYRCLINGMLSSHVGEFGHLNAETLCEKFKLVTDACCDFMQNIDFVALKKTLFTHETQNKCLRELCSEARQKKWTEDPDFVFDVGGQKLKKSKKKNVQQEGSFSF